MRHLRRCPSLTMKVREMMRTTVKTRVAAVMLGALVALTGRHASAAVVTITNGLVRAAAIE